jgi:nucleoid-associated protein YejK
MPKESVLTSKEKESFKIKKFIFHIIVQSSLNPRFLDEVELSEDQAEFFKERFSDASYGTQFEFNDKRTSDVFKNCTFILDNPEAKFLEISKILTASFQSHHKKTMNDGVLITALVSVLDKIDLVFLIKLDNRKVYGYQVKDQKAIMKEIKDTFVEDKKAIQKIAIVDVSENYVWDVLAFDRYPSPGKAIRDYFADFLAVHERETPYLLTQKTVSAINKWAVASKLLLDPNQEISAYKKRCIEYLRNTVKAKSKELIQTVVFDEDANRAKELRKSLQLYMEEKGLFGQEFQPNQKALDKSTLKNIRRTAEGIKIEWEGDARDVNIDIPNTPDPNDGLYHISIKTGRIDIEK